MLLGFIHSTVSSTSTSDIKKNTILCLNQHSGEVVDALALHREDQEMVSSILDLSRCVVFEFYGFLPLSKWIRFNLIKLTVHIIGRLDK